MYKKCLNCGEETRYYPAGKDRKRFCSKKCQQLYTHVEKKCIQCGKVFTVAQSRYASLSKRFKMCSDECYNNYGGNLKRERDNKNRYECTTCGVEFISVRNGKTSMKFCSQECSKKYIKGVNHHSYRDGTTIGAHGYRSIKVGDKYILEHRLVMEDHLERKLLHDEVIHHIDGDRLNNSVPNLRLMEKREHDRWHNQQRREAKQEARQNENSM